jgi:hypothetical protein
MKSYVIKYRVGHTNTVTTIQLINGSESEAIAKLKQRCRKDYVILSIEEV